MTSGNINVSQLTLHNPSRLSDAEIVAAFVARKALFVRLVADIAAEKSESRAQHHLIVGQRGMGKSAMLTRLAAELRTDATLSNRFVPLVFAEEQYSVDRLSKLWLNCLDSLADAAERIGDTATSSYIDLLVGRLKRQLGNAAHKDETSARTVLDAFLDAAKKVGKRPVLLLDNLQLVFERLEEREQHALRELLMRAGSPILIGASPSPPPQDYAAAFYDHFKVHYLQPLSLDEMRSVMIRLAEVTARADVRKTVLAHPERLKTLRELTGGNPRAVVLLFFLYTEDFSPTAFVDLENLLDRVTPLYKARIEELADQQQVIVSAVADHWAPITARAVSEATGLPTTSTSAQLDRLEKTGFVEKVEIFGQASAGYQISERLFNVWFLMRSASRRQRREVEFLVRFIESFYEAEDRARLARQLMREHDFTADRLQFAKALARTLEPIDKEDLSRHSELDALRQKASARWKLDEVIDFSTLPELTIAFDELREKLRGLVPIGGTVDPEEFAEQVLGDRRMFIDGERKRLTQKAERFTAEEVNAILERIANSRREDVEKYGEESVTWFRQRLSAGQLRSVNDLEDWKRSFMKADSAQTMQLMVDAFPWWIVSALDENVLSRIRCLLAPKSDSGAARWYDWGVNLSANLGLPTEAELAYHKAIELDPTRARSWCGLGDLFHHHLCRFEEAEAAYRKAIELDPEWARPWADVGNLLRDHLRRFEEAEAAYRKAIELDPEWARPWADLGNLLRDHLRRFDESEAAYHKAIEINPKWTAPWNNLGNLYCDHYARFMNATSAFAKALEIDDGNETAAQNIVFLKRDFIGDLESARRAFESLQGKASYEFQDTFHLQQALFAAYEQNWGHCRECLTSALATIGNYFPSYTDVDWFRASAVLLHLNYAEELLSFLRDRGDDVRLRPWYEALSALHRGDRRYLQNIPLEARATAEYNFDQIEKRLQALPEKTRRWIAPHASKRRKT